MRMNALAKWTSVRMKEDESQEMREKPVYWKTSTIKHSEETLNLTEQEKNLSVNRVELDKNLCTPWCERFDELQPSHWRGPIKCRMDRLHEDRACWACRLTPKLCHWVNNHMKFDSCQLAWVFRRWALVACPWGTVYPLWICLLYTSDAADE